MKFKTTYIFLVLFVLIINFTKCSENSPQEMLTPVSYTPPELTNTTWEMWDNPESVGWSSEKLQEAYNFSNNLQTAAVMIIYDGKVLYHWGEIERKFYIHSCRKSLMSALYGIHVDEGNIDLSKTIADLDIDDKPPSLSDLEKTATVKMLLQARSGIYHPAAAESPSMKAARPERHSHAPGTFWYYNNWDFNALGTIFEQESGTKIFEEFKNRIGDPIGMEDFEVSDGIYQYEEMSIHPAYHFRLTARDMARFGLLFLQNGTWEDTRIISEEWIEESTKSHSDTGTDFNYGYMWWIADSNKSNLPAGSYLASGYHGHYIVVIPEMNLVIVHRVNTDIDHQVNDLEFKLLLEFIKDAKN